jgi:hypothetical protein
MGENNRCIWCLQATETLPDVEHIIPEALGCPPGFTLPASLVCRRCNNGLSHLDTAVIDEFDFLVFFAGVSRKRGRSPAIRSRGNALGTVEDGMTTISFNMGKKPCKAHNGEHLPGYRGGKRHVQAVLGSQGNGQAKLSYEVTFGQGNKFVRGLLKIAFSSLTYFCGSAVALSEEFAPIREFVRAGIGKRHAFLRFSDDSAYSNRVWPPYHAPSGECCITFRIAMAEFLVDLSPNESQLETLRAKASELYGGSDWCLLPTIAAEGPAV